MSDWLKAIQDEELRHRRALRRIRRFDRFVKLMIVGLVTWPLWILIFHWLRK